MEHQAHQEHQDIVVQQPSAHLDRIAKEIVDSAFCVHKEIGAGLLESAYEAFLVEELMDRGLNVKTQVPVRAKYKNKTVELAYRLDLVVEGSVVVELKSVEKLSALHEAQMLTYLKLSGMKLGFLMNFNTRMFRDGIRRFAV